MGVVLPSLNRSVQFSTVPELHSTVITTGGKHVRLVRVVVQPTNTRPVRLVKREGETEGRREEGWEGDQTTGAGGRAVGWGDLLVRMSQHLMTASEEQSS